MQDHVFRRKPMSQIIAPSADEARERAETEARAEAAPEQNLPDKYSGKTTLEIAEMHMNSEKRLGQIQNEVGQLRGLVSDLASVQRASTPATPEPAPVDVSGDQLINDPVGTIRKVVQPMVDSQTQGTAQDSTDIALYRMEQNSLISDFGDPMEIAQKQEFQEFVNRTPSRVAEFEKACDPGLGIGQVRAARRLLEDFTDFEASLPTSEATQNRTNVAKAKAVATEGAGPAGAVATADPIYEADVVALINSNPEKYRSPSFQKELHAAIREGRFIKNG